MTQKQQLEKMIDEAWLEYNHLFAYEISTGYDSSMDMAERREAEGYAHGLGVAYYTVYGEHYLSTVEICDEDTYEQWLEKEEA